MKRTLAVLAIVGALLSSAPLSAQAKPDWSKLPANTAAPATNAPAPANDPGAANVAANDTAAARPKVAPAPQKPAVQEAPTDLNFPKLSGRVVDQARLLSAAQVADLTSKSAALEAATGRQFVVATVDSLNGHTIEDYGYQLGRVWGIGQEKQDDGVILLVAPNQRKVRIETGYGARVFLTDAVSSVIINQNILPAFRNGDMGGGIVAGADQIINLMQMSPEDAARYAQQAAAAQQKRQNSDDVGFLPVIFWMFIILFVIFPIVRSVLGGGRKYRRRGGGHAGPIILWGPGDSGSGWSSGSGWGGGSSDFGGFSGGGGSFGGGGASGSW
nr:TPM domain-containing protein [uncultured Sphingomonas sp.]